MSIEPELNLSRRLPKQHGAFSRQQALVDGFSRRQIDRRLSIGRWHRLDQGVYAHAAYEHTWEQRCVAAVLGERSAVLGGSTGAFIHGLPQFTRGTVRITVPSGRCHSSRLARVRRSDLIEPHEVRGFRVNSVPLILVEVASEVTSARLERALEDAVLRGLTTVDAVREWLRLLEGSRRPGLVELRSIVADRVDGFVPPESELERLLFEALAGGDIPPIVRQSPFPWSPEGPERVDGYIPQWGILLEADGRRWHARMLTMEADRGRDQEASRRGLHPLRFGWQELRDDPRRVHDIVVETGIRRRDHFAA